VPTPSLPPSTDLIVIGSGLGGLCCAALAARHGLEVVVLEAHDRPGGAAHGFERRGFQFESGPSLWSGLGRWPSRNPLAQVLRAVGEAVPCRTYQEWGLLLPEGNLRIGVGSEAFSDAVRQLRGPAAAEQWRAFMAWLEPACRAAAALPLLALRSGPWGTARVLGPQGLAGLLAIAPQLPRLSGAFGPLARRHLQDPFLLHWVDLLCFLISGLSMDQTSAAAMATLFGEWFEPEASLDYPEGGSPAVVEALCRGLERHGGVLVCQAPVERIEVKDGRARGVRLGDCRTLKARCGVVANLSPWDLVKLLDPDTLPAAWRAAQQATPACASFLHWHLGLRGDDLGHLPIHHVWVGDWQRGVTAERNMVVLSMPSLLDPSLAPGGHQVLHGYTPANEPWALWQGLERGSSAYERQKRERCALFHPVLERVLPDWSSRAVLELQGTPLTHRHYLRMHNGSYGPALPADRGPFPAGATPIAALRVCGAGVFPGIGVPPVAISGALAAHHFVPVAAQRRLLEELAL